MKNKERKKLKDTRLFKTAKEKFPEVLGKGIEIFGDLTGRESLENLGSWIQDKVNPSPIDQIALNKAKEYDLAEIELYLDDVQDARNREIEIAKTGKKDPMMLITGIVGVLVFVFMVVAIVFKPELQDNKLLIHLLGMVEGVAITIFSYYYGSSKGSKDKTALLKK